MSAKKFGKNITVDQLAGMVMKSLLSIENTMVTKGYLDERLKDYPTRDEVKNIVKEEIERVLEEKFEVKLKPIHEKLDDLKYHEKRISVLEEKVVLIKNAMNKNLKTKLGW